MTDRKRPGLARRCLITAFVIFACGAVPAFARTPAVPAQVTPRATSAHVRVKAFRVKKFHGMAKANVTFVANGNVTSIDAELQLITIGGDGGVALQKVQLVSLLLPANGVVIARFAATGCTTNKLRIWKLIVVATVHAAGGVRTGIARSDPNVIRC